MFFHLCFLPPALIYGCGTGPIPTVCPQLSALSKEVHPPSRTLTLSLSPAALLHGDRGSFGGRTARQGPACHEERGHVMRSPLRLDGSLTFQQLSGTWSGGEEKGSHPLWSRGSNGSGYMSLPLTGECTVYLSRCLL